MAVKPSRRRNIGLAALFSVVLALLPFGPHVESARATAGTGTITIVSTGGTSVGTNWTFSAGTMTTVDGDPASINASDVVGYLNSGNLTIQAASIIVNASVVATTGSSSLTLSTTGDIDVIPAMSLTTIGGNMSLLADSDGDGAGGIRIGDSGPSAATLTSGGGNITLGGNGGEASNSAGLFSSTGVSTRYFSVAVQKATINAGGGNISIFANSGTTTLDTWCFQNLGTIQTSGTGTITVNGDCSSLTGAGTDAAAGIYTSDGGIIQTENGAITIVGKSTVVRTLAYGISIKGKFQSRTGQITFRDETANTNNANYRGTNLASVQLGQGSLADSSSNISLIADEFNFTPVVNSTGTLTVAPASSDFQATLTIPSTSSISNISGLTLGAAGNTQNIVIQDTFTVGGPLTIFSDGSVSQSAAVTATSLSLNGSGSFTLTNTTNDFGTIAGGASGSKLGSVSVYDASGGLTIGTVGSLEGITATGDVLVEAGAGDITLAQGIATDSTSNTAITLNAGDSTAAGTDTGGNIVIGGSPTLTTGTGGISRLFSGSEAGSTGLTALAGGASNTYFGVDENSTPSPALSSGTTYALYRGKETPQLASLSNRSVTVGASTATMTAPSATNKNTGSVAGSTTWSSSNSSVASVSGSTLTYGSVGTAVVTATFSPSDTSTYQSATTTFTVTVSAAGGGGGSASSSSSSEVSSPPAAPPITPRQTRLTLVGPNTDPVPRPVQRLGLRFDADAPSRATVGGAPANLVKSPAGSDGLSVAAGAFQFGVSLADADGAEVQTDTPSQSPELFVPRGQSAAVSGKGSYPGSFVQLFLPGNGNESRELARISVRSDGTFASDLSFQAGALELPVPIGRQVLQVVGYDEQGNQTVVDMTINIGQGVPTPEPNRQIGELPALTAGQSLATSGGIPETVSVTGAPDTGNVVVEGADWVISVNADRDNGVVENADGNVLVRLNPSSVGTAFGNGFLPGTLATVWLFSEPTLMTTVIVDENGEFSSEFLVDGRLIAPGEHTLQVQGVGSDGFIKAANLGVLVEQPVEVTTESASGLLWWVIGAFLLVVLFLLLLLARRRRSQEQ